jgi:quinol monooxygenase YgiN
MLHVMASIVVRPEHASAARALLADLAAKSRREPGCVAYELFQRADQPHVFRTVEQWLAAADVDAHMKTAHVAAAIATGGPMFAAPPEIVTFTRVDGA